MISLWIAAAVISAGAGLLILRRARRRGAAGGEALEVALYRRALAEIDDLAERDLLGPDERVATRAEAGRRLLRAAERPRAPPGAPVSPLVILLVAAAAPMLAVGLYAALGSPDRGDQPFAARLATWRDQPQRANAEQLAAALRAVAAERPRDPEPQRRLAVLEFSLGDGPGAVHALRKALAIAPARADLQEALGEMLVLEARGVVGPDPQAVFRKVLAIDPTSATARYYLARAAIAGGDPAGGLAAWRGLLTDLAPADPRRAQLAAEIAAVERTGALASAQGEAGPSAAQLNTAIAGMVDSLAARLATAPDDPQGWVRLVRAYGVLGQGGKQAAALARARALFASRPEILAQLVAAARPAT